MEANIPTLSVNRGLLYVLFAAIAWGTGGAVAAILYQSSGLGPIAVSFWRFAIGVLMLVILVMATGSNRPHPLMRAFIQNQWGRMMIIGIGLAVYQTAYFAAVGKAGLALATVVTLGLGPILIAIGSHLTMGEKIRVSGLLTITFAIIGLGLLMGGEDLKPHSLIGLALAILSAVGYAGVTLITRSIGRYGQADSFYTTFFGTIVGMICLLPFALLEGIRPLSGHAFENIVLLGYLGLVPTAMAYMLFNAGLTSIRATTASIIALVEPVTAAIIAILFLGENLTPVALCGMAVLMASVLVLSLSERH